MNDVYFGCTNCRVLVDAGYRWAYWELEARGIVRSGEPFSLDSLESAVSYWSPPHEPQSAWLTNDVLPAVQAFLKQHREHHLMYGEEEELIGPDPLAQFDWLFVGHLPVYTPRYFAEVLELPDWNQVIAWINSAETKPWWWELDEATMDLAKLKFEMVSSRT